MVVLWDVERRRALGVLRDDGVPVYSLAFSLDGELLFVGDAEGKFEVYSVEKRARVAELRGHLGPIYGIAVHPGGSSSSPRPPTGPPWFGIWGSSRDERPR